MKTPMTMYSRVEHLLGSVESGIDDLGENHREHLKRIIDVVKAK